MKVEFLPEAEEEFLEAARFYESKAPGVGMAFIVEVHKALSLTSSQPLPAPVIRGSIRKRVVNHFPFTIFYSVEDDLVVILSVAHHKRKPDFWRKRSRGSKR
ncbi:MAG TPA: type II toxin-antitoxin system RelE/ParE family toxin [Geomonas sp.]|nr:type II toxin-antitoxin system RelE/ParE family toxin [Geomonas sp.]